MTSDAPSGPRRPGGDRPRPANGGFDDPDVWSSDEVRPVRRPPGRGRERPEGARGPSRPPRRGPRREGRPAAPAAGPVRREAVDPDDGEYVELPPEGRAPAWLIGLGVLVLVVGAVVGAAWFWYQRQVDPPGEPGEVVAVVIPEGATTSDVASILDDEGVITSATLFNFHAGGRDLRAVQAGSYEFQLNSSFDEAIAALEAGPRAPVQREVDTLVVPEGLTVPRILARINEQAPQFTVEEMQALLDEGAVPSAFKPEGTTSYEGLLFPATYEIEDDTTALSLLTDMAAELEVRAAALGLEDALGPLAARYGVQLTPYEVLVVASLVQAEAGNVEEAPQIATVIYNRLEGGWALGIDATSRYLVELEGGSLDFESTSPFNTRRQPGLPPTPIAASGEFALEAAIAPAEGPWFYYVLTEPRSHTFAVTDAEFQAAKRICIERDLGCG